MVFDATKPCSYKAPKMHYNSAIITSDEASLSITTWNNTEVV